VSEAVTEQLGLRLIATELSGLDHLCELGGMDGVAGKDPRAGDDALAAQIQGRYLDGARRGVGLMGAAVRAVACGDQDGECGQCG